MSPQQTAIAYEKAGRYAEAAAMYQQLLNSIGKPDGDGGITGERLGYLLANGRGVTKNVDRARVLFNSSGYERFRIDLVLLDHHMLPQTPEDKTPDLIAKANAIVAEEQRKVVEQQQRAAEEERRRQEAWNAAHPEVARARASCRTSCSQAVSECNNRNLGKNWGSMFGGYHEQELDCSGFSQRCYAQPQCN